MLILGFTLHKALLIFMFRFMLVFTKFPWALMRIGMVPYHVNACLNAAKGRNACALRHYNWVMFYSRLRD